MDTLWAQQLGADSSCADREFKEGCLGIFYKSQTAVSHYSAVNVDKSKAEVLNQSNER